MHIAKPSDVVVVGGGLVGAASAYELAGAGLEVTLFDGPRAGRASDAGAGIASPQTFPEPDPDWYLFGAAAAAHLRSLVLQLRQEGHDLGADVFAECGSLVLALAEHESPWFEEVQALASARDPAIVEISPSEAKALFPPLGEPCRALYSPRSARVDGRRLAQALRRAARQRGVSIVAEDVSHLAARDQGVRVTAGGVDLDCAAAVLCAGAWSGPIAAGLGVEIPVVPTKGEIVHLGLGPQSTGDRESARWPIVQPVLNFYLVPWPGGRVACGGTFEPGAGFDVRPTVKGVHSLLRECLTIAPGLADATLLETRVGLRPMTPDERPVIGPLPGAECVHLCTGHGANGLLLGAYSAGLVATSIVTGRPPEIPTSFSSSRYSPHGVDSPHRGDMTGNGAG